MAISDSAGEGPRRPYRISVAAALAAGFGGLVFLAVGGALGIGLWSARENTLALLTGQAEAGIGALVGVVRNHLDPVQDGVVYLEKLVANGSIDPSDRTQLVAHMRGAMAPMKHVFGMGFISPDYRILRVLRQREGAGSTVTHGGELRVVQRAIAQARRRTGPYWGELIWGEPINGALINLRMPLWRDGKFLGLLTAVVSVDELSDHLAAAALGHDVRDRFILFDRNHVLAHARMVAGNYARSPDHPIPTLDELGDPVLSRLWRVDARSELVIRLVGDTRGHVINYAGKSFPVLYREVRGYGSAPLIVGAYIRPGSGLDQELRRLGIAAAAGIGVWILALLAALILGRRLGGPVRRLAEAARAAGRLDLDAVARLPGSRLRELDDAASAFNSMTTGLRWFETYVPRRLVLRLMNWETGAEVPSEMREVSVMFTDIVGFTPLAEKLGAGDTAQLLNAHFSLLAACIEALEGTVDKYIGDSVMAFWGAPLADTRHAEHACRAALAIREAVRRDNEARRIAGEAPLHVRIGIHAGPAIVGNIGAPGRINYTLIGDTVNVAQRLEGLAKEHAQGETSILVSDAVARAIAKDAPDIVLISRGSQSLRGRDQPIEVFSLEHDPTQQNHLTG